MTADIKITGVKKIIDPNPPDEKIPNYSAFCPTCGDLLLFVHDIQCKICNNKTKLWCRTCFEHCEVLVDF